MDKTFTFDNNIKSFERYKLNNSVITVLGEIHDSDNKSNITEYISNINNTDNTMVFLELDTNNVKNETYMKGINSSTIMDVVKKFRSDQIYYFDNRNDFLGGTEHFELYYKDISQLDFTKYINKYLQFFSPVRLVNETRENYEIRRKIIKELKTTNKEKKILDENIAKFKKLSEEYDNIEKHYETEREKLKNYYQSYSDEFEPFYNRDLENLNQQEREWQTKIRNKIEEYHEPLVYSFREFWANVTDENLLQMIRNIISSRPNAKFEFIIIVGLQHTRNLNYRFIHKPSDWMSTIQQLPPDHTKDNERIRVNYRADSFWDAPGMQLMELSDLP